MWPTLGTESTPTSEVRAHIQHGPVPIAIMLMSTLLYLVVAGGVVVQADLLNPFLDAARHKESLSRLESCFCQLQGRVEECCCDVETVDRLNQERVFPILSKLLARPFFNFFQVNLNKKCPYWPDNSKCVLRSCHVEACTEDNTPAYLKEGNSIPAPLGEELNSSEDSIPAPQGEESESSEDSIPAPQGEESESSEDSIPAPQGEESESSEDSIPAPQGEESESSEELCTSQRSSLSDVDTRISEAQREEFEDWQHHDDSEDNFCDPDDSTQGDLSYVDLSINPERFTGYAGHSAHRVWEAIYKENCFRPDSDERHVYMDSQDLEGMCLEKRAFYRLVSGIHASINTHLSALYLACGEQSEEPSFGPNLNEFVRRFDATTTNDQGPVWLKNLYFAYLLVLRAVTKAEPLLQGYAFYTGNATEDEDFKEEVMKIVQSAKSCPSLFDETLMFSDDSSEQLKIEFRDHFRNISRIMDCVGCDKCKLWGKLQVKGTGTALKILFSRGWQGTGEGTPPHLHLSRSEMVALFNVLGRLSDSLNYLQMFRQMLLQKEMGSTPAPPHRSEL